MRVMLNLIAAPGTGFARVTQAYSHPVALDQCQEFFRRHKRIDSVPFYDTAGSVKMLMHDRPGGAAAIASELAAKIYGARILKREIEDDRRNYTRFFLLEPRGAPARPPGCPRASRSESHQTGIASAPWPAVGIHVLSRSDRTPNRRTGPQGSGPFGRSGRFPPCSRQLSRGLNRWG